ncbi:MAG: hypothetical protein ACRDHL_09355 [Candidatus Promineifilaceae bacterium]
MRTRVCLGLAWLALALLAAGCASPAEEPTAPAPTPAGPSALQVAVVTDDFPAGSPRVPFVLFAGQDKVADAQAVTITAYDLSAGTPTAGWSGSAVSYSDYEVPYWVARPELPHAGAWGLAAEITAADGTTSQAQFAIQVTDDSPAPAVGELAPSSQNRTTADQPDLSLLTSDAEPEPALYEMTVAEAIASGKPTVVSLATPGFCQTDICVPVLDTIKAVFRDRGEEANFIHIEIYTDFEELTVAPEVEEWGLSSEPWTFVLDGDGRVMARFGGPLSPRELEAALAPLLA